MTLYSDLDLPRTVSSDAVKRAYRKKAKHTHPDAGGKPEDFARVHRAYLVLSDPAKRSKYDHDGTVDDSPSLDPLAEAKVLVLNFFMQAADADGVFSVDLIDKARQQFEHHISEIEKQKKVFEDKAARRRKLVKRLQHKDKHDFLRRGLQHEIANLERNLIEGDRQIAMRNEAIKLVKQYKFEFDKQQGERPLYRTVAATTMFYTSS